jgi:hypothetical protein
MGPGSALANARLSGTTTWRASRPAGRWPDSRLAWRSRTLRSRPAWSGRTSHRGATWWSSHRRPARSGRASHRRSRPWRASHRAAWMPPAVPPGRATPADAASPIKAAAIPAGAAPAAAVPTVTVTSPSELHGLRETKLIDSVMQAQRSSNKAGLRAAASRRHHRRSRGQGEHPQKRFPHDLLLGLRQEENR